MYKYRTTNINEKIRRVNVFWTRLACFVQFSLKTKPRTNTYPTTRCVSKYKLSCLKIIKFSLLYVNALSMTLIILICFSK